MKRSDLETKYYRSKLTVDKLGTENKRILLAHCIKKKENAFILISKLTN